MTIWIAFEDETQTEHHMEWYGHETVESANEELQIIIQMVRQGGSSTPNTYVYEADGPLYGYEPEEFDPMLFDRLDQITQEE